jgi:tRNA (guanine-N7-)-methyltransferase
MSPQPVSISFDQADSLLIVLDSILEPLRLDRLFLKRQPVEVELGCGDSGFLFEYARAHPETNFLGVERLLGRLRKLDRKGRRARLTNLRGLQIESSYFLRYLLPPGSCRALHLYFPDPWPKRKQRKHRLVNKSFTELAKRVLQPAGVVYLRTDDAHYWAQMQEVFRAAPFFGEVPTPPELQQFVTDFEREFRERGVVTMGGAFQRREAE